MKNPFKILNIIALVAVAFVLGKSILKSEKQELSGGHEHGGHEEEGGGHGGHSETEGGHEEHPGHSEEEGSHEEHPGHSEEEGGHAGHGDADAAKAAAGDGAAKAAGHKAHGGDFVELTQGKAEAAGIVTEEVGPAILEMTRTLFGEFRANEENLAHIAPRFPGIIQQVNKRLGDRVEKGETLVVVESNESLEAYDVRALISGTVILRDANRGEAVTEGQRLMTIVDLSTLWVDLNAYPQDYHNLKIGQTVYIKAPVLGAALETVIDYISPFGREGTQTMLARATVPNPDMHLRPGLFAEGKIKIATEKVPVAVDNMALQTWEEKDVIFVRDAHGFKATPVKLGRTDGKHTEILAGLEAGEKYAAGNSFFLKAELGKDMAAHEH